MKRRKQSITYAFIDATNIIYSASKSDWKMDFAKLSKYLKERFVVNRIFYYAGVDISNLKQLKFYEKLQQFNYELRLIPVKTFSDGRKKADVDSRMTFEIMYYFSQYDKAVIMTGDGDYYWVLEYLMQSEKQVWLLSFPKTTARELKKLFAGGSTDLTTIKTLVELKEKN